MITATVLGSLLLVSAVQDGPRVSARVSNATPSVGETIVFEITVERAGGGIDIATPAFPRGFVLQGSQESAEMQFSLPGGRRETRRREFVLQVTTPGRFRIPPVVVRVGSVSYRTNAVEVAVTGSAQPRGFTSSDEAWLRAAMSPETVYVGQQSTLTIEAGFSDDVRMRMTRPPIFDPPAPTGFWVQDAPGGVRSGLRTSGGRVTEVLTLQRAYFPLSAGRFAFAPARAIIDVREGFLLAPETRELRSNSPRLTVLPLPDAGRPADFKGAVGAYRVRVFLQPDTVAVGDPAQLTVEVEGTGNIKAAPPPVLPAIRGVEQFAPTEHANVVFNGATAAGTKQFQWVIIPERPGVIEIPAIAYSYFDPQQRVYRTVSSEPARLFVRAGIAAAADDAAGGATLGAVRPEPERESLRWVRSRGFVLAQIVPLLALALGLAWRRSRKPPARVDELRAELHALQGAQQPYAEFLRRIGAVVRAAVVEATGRPGMRTAGVADIASVLRACGVADATVSRCVALVERLETERFAPSAEQAVERAALVREADAVVAVLAGRARPAPTRSAIALVAFLQLTAGGSFDQGIAHYRAGEFAQSARSFETAIAADSTDVAAWVNLGNSYFRSGERGGAIWAWARAARAAPRDADIARNLRAAGAVEVLRTQPPLSVRPVEWYLLAALGWWAACGIVMVAVVRRRSPLAAWALPAIGAALVAIVVGALADGREYAVALNDATRLYGDPTVHSPVVRTVQGGAGLDVLERRGDWLRVRTVTQAEGWVESDAVGGL